MPSPRPSPPAPLSPPSLDLPLPSDPPPAPLTPCGVACPQQQEAAEIFGNVEGILELYQTSRQQHRPGEDAELEIEHEPEIDEADDDDEAAEKRRQVGGGEGWGGVGGGRGRGGRCDVVLVLSSDSRVVVGCGGLEGHSNVGV